MLSERTCLWIKDSLGTEVEIDSVKQLYGGISAIVYEVVVTVDGKMKEVVVKQYTDQSWLLEEPDLVSDEMENLCFIQRENVRAPVPIAVDVNGEETGYPSILMTKVDGAVVLEPEDFMSWTNGLANALASIHTSFFGALTEKSLPPFGALTEKSFPPFGALMEKSFPSVDGGEFPRTFSPYTPKEEIQVPSWGTVPEQWAQAARIVKGIEPNTQQTFIHRDFHPTNVLWRNGDVSGVVDWVNACRGPAHIDVSHCRLNLALLHGVEVADQFLAAYLKVASEDFEYHTYWDLLVVFDFIEADEPLTVYEGWVSLGTTHLTDKMMGERMEAYLMSLFLR